MAEKVDGSIRIKATIDTSGAESQLNKLGGKASSVFSKAAKIGAAALTAASGAVAAIAKSALDSYADYEQLVGGVETLFKDSADIVRQYADNAYKTAGMSANEYMETVTGFSASLLQSLGGDTEAAAEKANQALIDMSDNANKMGTDMEAIKNAYQGFAKQNYTMLDNLKLGYGGTVEEMERLLKDAEALSGVHYDISSFADIVDAIHVVQTELGITGTTALEASTTIQGSLASMKGAWENLLTGIADENADFDTLLVNFVDSVGTVAENILPRIYQILNGIGEMVSKLAPVVAEAIPQLVSTVLPSLLNAGVSMIGAIGNGIISALPALVESAFKIVQTLADSLSNSLPELIPAIADILVQIVETLIENVGMLVDAAIAIVTALAEGLIAAWPTLIESIPILINSLLNAILENAPKLLEAAVEIAVTLAKGIIQNIPKIIEAVPEIIAAILDAFGELGLQIIEIGKNIVIGLWDGICQMADWLKEQVKDFFGGIVDSAKSVLGIHSPSKVFASIGDYMMQGMAEGIAAGGREAVKATEGIMSALEKVAVPSLSGSFNGIAGRLESIKTPFAGMSFPNVPASPMIPPNMEYISVMNNNYNASGISAADVEAAVSRGFAAVGTGSTNVNVEFNGSLAALARVLVPAIKAEEQRRGPTIGNNFA